MHDLTIAPATELVPLPIDRCRIEALAGRTRAAALTLGEYADRYATTRGIREATARQYAISAEVFERWAGRPVLLDELDELLVSTWLREYGATVAPATVRSKRNQVVALWRAAADDYLCDPPRRRVRVARVPWTPREAWTVAEVRQLLVAARGLPRRHPCGLTRAAWFDLAIRLAWDTALRWGDLVRLRTADIHGDTFVVCQGKTGRPKGGRLHASTVAALDASLRACPRDVVVPWPASPQTFTAQVRRLVARAGIRPGTWKRLRRGSASNVEARNPGRGMAARQLGHAPGSKVAELHYIDPFIVEAAVDVVQPDDLGVLTLG